MEQLDNFNEKMVLNDPIHTLKQIMRRQNLDIQDLYSKHTEDMFDQLHMMKKETNFILSIRFMLVQLEKFISAISEFMPIPF